MRTPDLMYLGATVASVGLDSLDPHTPTVVEGVLRAYADAVHAIMSLDPEM